MNYKNPKVLLIGYGMSDKDTLLLKIKNSLPDQFYEATDGLVTLDIELGGDSKLCCSHNFDEIKELYPYMKDPDFGLLGDIPRIWYYENEVVLVDEFRQIAEEQGLRKEHDIVIVVTDLMFDGLGINYGDTFYDEKYGLIAVKNLLLGGFIHEDYTRELLTENPVIDRIIHEIGHYYGLRHTEGECLMSPRRSRIGPDGDPGEFCPEELAIIKEKLK